MDVEVSRHTFLTMIIEESVCFMSCEPICCCCNYSYVVHTEYIYIHIFINWTLRMSDNLPERVQILCHAHIICITVLENRIICCQIFCNLLLKPAFERIFNVMQLIWFKIKWHIKWNYLIKKFHDICLSYYFKSHWTKKKEITKQNIDYIFDILFMWVLIYQWRIQNKIWGWSQMNIDWAEKGYEYLQALRPYEKAWIWDNGTKSHRCDTLYIKRHLMWDFLWHGTLLYIKLTFI
jgi:hypothetical protein